MSRSDSPLSAYACISMPLAPSFLMTKILFFCIGVSFALAKVSVYSAVGLITDGKKEHASFMNIVEGVFMVGALSGLWLFSAFIENDPKSQTWLHVYWILAGLCAVNIFVLFTTSLDESGAHCEKPTTFAQDFIGMLWLAKKLLVIVFIISIFLYVLIEQGIQTWLPTFNKEILKLPSDMSVQAASIYAACLAAGRLSAGGVLRRVHWYPFICVCLLVMAGLVVVSMPMATGIEENPNMSWFHAPAAAFIFPIIGLFMAPIYPAINSVMLSALPKPQHSAMTGLIVIFSALGGTTGSRITGYTFEHVDGQTAFYFSLIPMAIILIALYFFKRETEKLAVPDTTPRMQGLEPVPTGEV
ncbi:MAG: MFS transporter [Rickettsiales bacterium]